MHHSIKEFVSAQKKQSTEHIVYDVTGSSPLRNYSRCSPQDKHFNSLPVAGTTGGIISSDDHEIQEESEEDEDEIKDEERKMEVTVAITPDDMVIVASFKLPLIVERDQKGEWTVRPARSHIYPTLFAMREKHLVKLTWIGWPGITPKDAQEKAEIEELLKQYDCVPIFFEQRVITDYLYFHNQVIRPLFHNFKGLSDVEYDLGNQELWLQY